MRRKVFKHAGGMMAALFFAVGAAAAAQQDDLERTGGPYVPTPPIVVDQMLKLANVDAKDYVIDLGSGDGVIVLTAARQFKASGMGVDIDPKLVQYANDRAAELGVADRVSFRVMDVFKADLSRASVVTLYLLPDMMMSLRAKLYLELKPGTRIVSHDYHFGDWRADDSITFPVPEKEDINGVPSATLWLWVVPARVTGRWNVSVEGGESYEVSWLQNYQDIEGKAKAGGRAVKVSDAWLKGDQVEFTTVSQSARQAYTGVVKGNRMSGTVKIGAKTARWTAVRTSPNPVVQRP